MARDTGDQMASRHLHGTTPKGESSDVDRRAEALRNQLADLVVSWHGRVGARLPDGLETALRTVPRHEFVPGASLEQAYADESIVTKRSERGVDLSAVSAPSVISGMQGQLDDLWGKKVLEIGSGGYNAALLAERVGPAGEVTTLDIDAEVIDRARACLDAAGYGRVRTVCADGEFGAAEFAPYDAVIVTVGAWDIPPAWVDQLAPGGRLVVPLRLRGLTRSWALEKAPGGRLVSRSHLMCGFVPMQGAGEHQGRSIPLHEDSVGLWTDELTPVDARALDGVLDSERHEVWTGITVRRGESLADLNLWLMMRPSFARLTATQQAIDSGLVSPTWRLDTPALIGPGSVAYRAQLRETAADPDVREFGAYGHGPHGADLAEELANQIRIWDRDHRRGPGPMLTALPHDAPPAELPDGLVVAKRHHKFVLSWPAAEKSTGTETPTKGATP